jgi:hypothetical protein
LLAFWANKLPVAKGLVVAAPSVVLGGWFSELDGWGLPKRLVDGAVAGAEFIVSAGFV